MPALVGVFLLLWVGVTLLLDDWSNRRAAELVVQNIDRGSPVTEHRLERSLAAHLVGQVGPIG
jgi:hypothetical protein